MRVIKLDLMDNEKIAFIGDLHFDNRSPESRVDDILETAVDKLKDVLEKCVERNVKALFIGGDVFNRLQVTHEAINELGSCLMTFKDNGVRLFTILGNHDILRNAYDNFQRTPLQTLFTFNVLEHINLENRVIVNNKVLITPVDYFEFPPVAEASATTNVLLAHMFYNQSALMGDERHNMSKSVVQSLGYDMAFLGHDHEEYPIDEIGKTLVVRSGSMLRGTSHNYNFTRKPCFMVCNDLENITRESMERVEISCRDYKDVASSYVLNKKSLNSISGLKDVLSNLAEKLSMGSEADGDRILDIIKTDESLPVNCRALLMKYIGEQ